MVQWKYSNEKDIYTTKVVNGVTFLTFDKFNKTGVVNHGFSTRLGGVSADEWSTMNLSFVRGDKDEDVHENFTRIANAIGVKKDSIVSAKQTHTANVKVVDRTYCGSGIDRGHMLEDIDGLVTNDPNVCLFTSYADCVPLYFLDPVQKVIGLSHSGWKGTVNKIGHETISVMCEEFDSDKRDIIVAIGPSICQQCYEVSEDVIDQFKMAFDRESWKDIFIKGCEDGKYQLDLWKANEIILSQSGIENNNIVTTNICTACNAKNLFSHRVSKGRRGNLGALMSLK